MPDDRPFVVYGDAMSPSNVFKKPQNDDSGDAKMICQDCTTISECRKIGRCKRIVVPGKPMIDK